jgi:hypothetical protein
MKNDLLPPRQARDKCKEKLNKSRFHFHAGSLWQGNIGLLQEPLGFERRAEQCLPGPRHLTYPLLRIYLLIDTMHFFPIDWQNQSKFGLFRDSLG